MRWGLATARRRRAQGVRSVLRWTRSPQTAALPRQPLHRSAQSASAFDPVSRPCGRFLLALVLLMVAVVHAEVPDSPRVLLAGANVPRAKALALDAALIKGWRVAVSEREHVVFETLLDAPASDGPPGVVMGTVAPPAQTLLRIRADFTPIDAGVIIALRADERWYAGTGQEWATDVTQAYRANLMNALRSLQEQWAVIAPPGSTRAAGAEPTRRAAPSPGADQSAPTTSAPALRQPRTGASRAAAQPPATAGAAQPTQRTAPPPAPAQPAPQDDAPKGVWAYHAEELAAARGCELGELGAVLLREDAGTEVHRVHCRNGTSMLVRCDRERCVEGR